MKTVPVQDAVGMVLCHDVTQIIPGRFKGPAFRKGHILQAEDVPRLLNMGKEHIYAWPGPPPAPVLPGAMFMLAYIGQVAVLGLPGCVMYHDTSIFDVILPRLVAGETIERRDFVKLAHGGLCGHCRNCNYPDCGFGKGA